MLNTHQDYHHSDGKRYHAYSETQTDQPPTGRSRFLSGLQDKVDVVVTDSPIILSPFYANDPVLGDEFDTLCTKVFNSYDSMNVFVNRVKRCIYCYMP